MNLGTGISPLRYKGIEGVGAVGAVFEEIFFGGIIILRDRFCIHKKQASENRIDSQTAPFSSEGVILYFETPP